MRKFTCAYAKLQFDLLCNLARYIHKHDYAQRIVLDGIDILGLFVPTRFIWLGDTSGKCYWKNSNMTDQDRALLQLWGVGTAEKRQKS